MDDVQDVFVLLQCRPNVSRQRGEGYNDKRMGLVEIVKELVDTIGLALHHHQSLHTIRTLTQRRKLGTENYHVKISCDSKIQSLLSQWWNLTFGRAHSNPYSLISPSANPP